MTKRVVICGGSGLIGSALAENLTGAGYEVVIVSRHPEKREITWDQLPQALEGALAVVNLSGRNIACKFTPANKQAILSSRIDSAKKIAEAIAKCSVKPGKWINSSATGFYGNRDDELLNESSSPGKGFQAEVCIQWEDACLKSPVQVPKVVVRTGVVLTARGGVLRSLIPLVKGFNGGPAGNGKQWLPWIHIDDIVGIYRWAIENETPEIIGGSTLEPVRNRDFMAWLRKTYHRPWAPPIPRFMIMLVGKLIGPDASLVLDSCRIIPSTIAEFKFKFPTLESIEDADL